MDLSWREDLFWREDLLADVSRYSVLWAAVLCWLAVRGTRHDTGDGVVSCLTDPELGSDGDRSADGYC